jgi:2-dehydro-3-deoxyphosphogluconate aldolase/(4S)-4-hydroxy-2-oxoglutarate aldolase
MSTFVQNTIEESKIIVIVRRLYGDAIVKLASALVKGGLRMMEVTFDQADPDCLDKTAETIALLRSRLEGEMLFGAGTVLTPEQVVAAAKAGAQYIISPNVSQRVIGKTKELGLVSIPGAMTPSEMVAAHEYGADYVKVFPINELGLSYMKNVRAPLPHIKFIATAGVNEENFAAHLAAGFVGAGVSGRLTDRKLIDAGDFDELTRRAQVFATLAKQGG